LEQLVLHRPVEPAAVSVKSGSSLSRLGPPKIVLTLSMLARRGHRINNQPRKVLDWRTAAEAFIAFLSSNKTRFAITD
jgi:hypothetical protein